MRIANRKEMLELPPADYLSAPNLVVAGFSLLEAIVNAIREAGIARWGSKAKRLRVCEENDIRMAKEIEELRAQLKALRNE